MAATEVNGNPGAMSAFSSQLVAPAMPQSMTRLGTPPNLAGLFEGIVMSLLDKAATAELAAFITKVSKEMADYSTSAKASAATYSAADVAGAFDLATATAKLAKQGIDLVKQLAASSSAQSATTGSTGKSTDQSAGTTARTTA